MFRPILVLFLAVLFLSACAQVSAPSPTSTVEPSPTATLPPPTDTPVPSATPSPSPVPASELRRPAENGLDMEAQRLDSPPILDGDLNEWANFPCYTLDQKEQIAYGDPASWGAPADLSGSLCWGWDDEALYLAVEVRDDTLRIFSKGNFWENDYIELWVDADLAGDFDQAKNNGDDFQFGFLPGNFADIPARATVFVPGVSTSKLRQIELAFIPIEGGYRGEVKIPWATFGDKLDLTNHRLGVALAFSDCDAEQPAQEMMISTAPQSIAQWGNPALWNNLDLRE